MIVAAYVLTTIACVALGALLQRKYKRVSTVMYFIGGILVVPFWYPLNLWLSIVNDDYTSLIPMDVAK